MPSKNKNGEIVFNDYPDFKPNLTPSEIFELGAFGGTYWRPIKSQVTGKSYQNVHKQYPSKWWTNLSENHLTRSWEEYDPSINKYGVKVGTTLEYWEDKGWITEYHPYGWVQWYCDFYLGKRSPDDQRQIKRWKQTAGPNSRFRKWLVKLIVKNGKKWNDYSVSPKIRQTLLHWAYELTLRDFNEIRSDT